MEGKEIHVDFGELEKQRKKDILEKDKYCLAEIIIGKNDHMPIAHVEIHNVSSIEVAALMGAMREIIISLAKRDPAAFYMFQKQDITSEVVEEEKQDNIT